MHLSKKPVFPAKQKRGPKYRILKDSVLHKYTIIVYLYILQVTNLEKNGFFLTL